MNEAVEQSSTRSFIINGMVFLHPSAPATNPSSSSSAAATATMTGIKALSWTDSSAPWVRPASQRILTKPPAILLSSTQSRRNCAGTSHSTALRREGEPELASRYGASHFRAAARTVASEVEEDDDISKAKFGLLNAVLETGRGLTTTKEQRAVVEEALVGVERFNAGKNLELDVLDGTWLLQYTTAPDVIQILQASVIPFLQVGQIFQKFECTGRTDGGVVKNVVRWGIPRVLQGDDGATLVVNAKFSVVSPRSIALSFQEAQLGQVEISDGLQAFLAPAILPRTFLNLEVLQFLRNLNVRVPLSSNANNNERVPVGLWYYLTYLDSDMLVGRALGSGGVFIFRRTQELQLP